MSLTDTTKLVSVGNSTGATFKQDTLREAGFVKGDVLRAQVEPGRIVLVRDEDAYDETMDLGRESFVRYANAYKAPAK